MNPIIELIEEFLKLFEAACKPLFELIETLITGTPRRNKEYKANFAPSSMLLSRRNDGFCLTGRRNLTVKNSFQNALIIGSTGTGKSSVVLLPSIYSMNSSFIIHDPSGELFLKSSGFLKARGYEVKVLNFSTPAFSSGYNPLNRTQNSSEIQKVASLLIKNSLGSNSKDPFWNLQSIALLSMIITILKTQEPEYQNLYNVRQLLNQLGSDPESVDAIFSKEADDILFSEYKSFLSADSKVISGVIATCKAALQMFSDDAVALVTSFDSINMQSFRHTPTALFIQNSVSDQKYYSVLTSLFFEQFFSSALGRFPTQNELDIFLLIDEASSLTLPTLPVAIANCRKHSVGIMLLLQDFAQLINSYGRNDAEAIKSNCYAKLYFSGQSLETAEELEQILGKYEYLDDKNNKVIRPLLTADEIRVMRMSRALLICGNQLPIVAKLTPYYERRELREYSTFPPAEIKAEITSPNIPILDLTNFSERSAA